MRLVMHRVPNDAGPWRLQVAKDGQLGEIRQERTSRFRAEVRDSTEPCVAEVDTLMELKGTEVIDQPEDSPPPQSSVAIAVLLVGHR